MVAPLSLVVSRNPERAGAPPKRPSSAYARAAAAPFALPSGKEKASARGGAERSLALSSPPTGTPQRPPAPNAGAARPVVRAPNPSEPTAAYGLVTGRGLY